MDFLYLVLFGWYHSFLKFKFPFPLFSVYLCIWPFFRLHLYVSMCIYVGVVCIRCWIHIYVYICQSYMYSLLIFRHTFLCFFVFFVFSLCFCGFFVCASFLLIFRHTFSLIVKINLQQLFGSLLLFFLNFWSFKLFTVKLSDYSILHTL